MRRFRRLRSNESIRSLVRETRVDKKDLIYPIFVAEGENIKKPVESMPNVYQYSLDRLDEILAEISESSIAGTYTPITLYYLQGAVGWILFGIVWGAAIFGIVMNSINLEKARIPSIFCYVAMGWVIIFAIKPLIASMPSISLVFLIIGGAFYTLGIIFYAIKKVKYFHSIWHLFTIAGSVFHYFAILLGFWNI